MYSQSPAALPVRSDLLVFGHDADLILRLLYIESLPRAIDTDGLGHGTVHIVLLDVVQDALLGDLPWPHGLAARLLPGGLADSMLRALDGFFDTTLASSACRGDLDATLAGLGH